MAITPIIFECKTCGHQTLTRTALGHADYQEFAFPCGGCELEMRFGMKLPLNKRMLRAQMGRKKHGDKWFEQQMKRFTKMRNVVLVNLQNARVYKKPSNPVDTLAFDGETLSPHVHKLQSHVNNLNYYIKRGDFKFVWVNGEKVKI